MNNPKKYRLIAIIIDNNVADDDEPYTKEELRTYCSPYGLPAGIKVESVQVLEELELESESKFRNRFILKNLNNGKTYISGDFIEEGLYQIVHTKPEDVIEEVKITEQIVQELMEEEKIVENPLSSTGDLLNVSS